MNNRKPQLQSYISVSSSTGEEQRYRLEKQIGGGGMGNVFLATDARLGKQVALKLLKETLVDDREMTARFERELAICAALESQHIVQVSDYGITADGHPFYVMEYLHGQTLGQLMAQKRRLSPQQTAIIMAQVCAGMQLAHEGINFSKDSGKRVKVIHRDLKPENIFLVPTVLGDLVKIIDFGIAKIRDLQAEYSTVTNSFLGTCHYAAPEQLTGAKSLDERADIYSLGLILYEMLTGFDPFGFNFRDNRVSGETWLLAHASKPPQPLRSQPGCEHLSPQLEAVVMQCLQKSPQDRFTSVRELNQTLQAAVSQQTDRETVPTLTLKGDRPIVSQEVAVRATERLAKPESELTFSASVTSKTVELFSKSNKSRVLRRSVFGLLLGGVCAGGITLSQLPRFSAPNLTEKTAIEQTLPDPTEKMVLQQTLQADSPVWSLALSADGQTLVSGGENDTIEVWNRETNDLEFTFRQLDTIRSLSLSNDGTILASASGNSVEIWNLQQKTVIRTLKGHQSTIWSVDISADGSMLASASDDGTIKLWNLHTGELLRTFTGHTAPVFAVNFSPNGLTLVSASQDNTVKLWNVQNEQLRQTLTGHTSAVRDVAFDPTGQHLASASWDGTVKLWNRQTGKELHTFAGHDDRAIAVTFSPDGKTLASSSVDRTVKLWDWKEQVLLETLSGNAGWVLSLVFDTSGTNLIGSGKDGTIKIWQRSHW